MMFHFVGMQEKVFFLTTDTVKYLVCEPILVSRIVKWSSVVPLLRSNLEALSREWSVTASGSASLSFRVNAHDIMC